MSAPTEQDMLPQQQLDASGYRMGLGKSVAGQSGQNSLPLTPSELATLDEKHFENHRILAHRPRSEEADAFRILRTQILQNMHKAGLRTLAITSPDYGDGKTTIAVNLAISIAMDLKQTVLLVDLDLRKPNLHEYLGLTPRAGLSDYLINDVPIKECLIRPPFHRLNTLPGGTRVEHSSELLGSPKMTALAQELKNRYPDRLVIYDMPPVLRQDDVIAFAPNIDGILLVTHNGFTQKEALKRSLDVLGDATIVGTVLNNTQ
ncbi:MAG: CpsD/CapB family tyrosine-protein kinase [Bdellovibrionales bacterium]